MKKKASKVGLLACTSENSLLPIIRWNHRDPPPERSSILTPSPSQSPFQSSTYEA